MSIIHSMENLLPVTVVSAIALFFLKEIVEFFKKKSERERKINAYKVLVSEELLKNAWTIKQLRDFSREIQDDVFEKMTFSKNARGEFRILIYREYCEPRSVALPVVHTAIFDKAVVDIAALDSRLFQMSRDFYEHLAEVKHIRDSILNFAEDESMAKFIKGLPSYANSKLDDAEASSKALFKWCTGKEMERPKLRSFA
ncbi:hypothetical protein [Pseudomonas viridiflava]|uniref:hypothetical protein n=1 Tax=Pseudomonas viridiflava TaxID=33069 RepID=UPI0013DC6BF1|nr:hypothetical protein [Pseudomonas viridiflava]